MELIEDVDYYLDKELGLVVLTSYFLLKMFDQIPHIHLHTIFYEILQRF